MPEPQFEPQFDQINYGTGAYISNVYNPSASVKERFITWWGAFAAYASEHPFDMIYMEEVATSNLYPLMGQQPSGRFYDETRNIIADGQREGIIKPMPASLINQFVRTSLINCIKVNMISGNPLSADAIESLVYCCWDGISVRQ